MTLPMPTTAGADPRSFPLLAQLFSKHGYTEVNAGEFRRVYRGAPVTRCCLFTEDPFRFKETLDLAVIVPEIARAFAGRFEIGVLLPEAAREFQPRYGFRRWPAFVVLRDGQYVGAVDGLRDWDDYVGETGRLLVASPSRPPAVGIAVRGAGEDGGTCGA